MFQALAIKYRPKTFSELIGQDAVSQTLSLALDTQRLGHAYLFSGLRGSGKTSSARIFAKSLNCQNGPTSQPCGICADCVAASQGKHLDIIEMDAASSRKIDDIRDLIEQTKYVPAMGRFKIFIIDEVHMLTRESYNALLKTLEEPPAYVKFILATTDVLKIPATILSRSQHFRFKKIPERLVLEHLVSILTQEQIPYEQEALEMIARSGSGSLRDTLTLLDQAIIYSKQRVEASAVAQMLGILDPQLLENLFEALLLQKKEELFEMAEQLEHYECEMVLEEFASYLKDQIKNTHQKSKFPLAMVDRFFRIITDSKNLLFLNANSSFVLTLTLLKMLEALKIKELDEMIQDLEQQIFTDQIPSHLSSDVPKTPIVSDKPVISDITQTSSQQQTHAKELFAALIDKIYTRHYDLGLCFEKHVSLVSFSDGVLCWNSTAEDECKKRLREGYSFIKSFVDEIFGSGTKIEQNAVKTQSGTKEQHESMREAITKESPKPLTMEDLLENPLIHSVKDHLGIKKITISELEE